MRRSGASLSDVKATLSRQIDAEAERVRASIITLGAGQAMVYDQKRREAETYLADPAVALEAIPHIVDEAAVRGISVADMAGIVMASAMLWIELSKRIERIRVGHKLDVEAAASSQDARAAAFIDWSPVFA